MTAGSGEADRQGPQGLLTRGRGPPSVMAIQDKSGKTATLLKRKRLQFIRKRDNVIGLLRQM